MHPDNPAVWECKKSKNTLHTWKRNPDQTATCKDCKIVLSKIHANEAFRGYEDA